MWTDGQKDMKKLTGIFCSFVTMHKNGYCDVNLTELAKIK
jgi:hypothetical protein